MCNRGMYYSGAWCRLRREKCQDGVAVDTFCPVVLSQSMLLGTGHVLGSGMLFVSPNQPWFGSIYHYL